MSGTSGDSGPAINVVLWLLFAVAFIAVVLRVNARTRRNHQLGWDDYLMIFSLVSQLEPSMFTANITPATQPPCLYLRLGRNQSRPWKAYGSSIPGAEIVHYVMERDCNRHRHHGGHSSQVSCGAAHQHHPEPQAPRKRLDDHQLSDTDLFWGRPRHNVLCKFTLFRRYKTVDVRIFIGEQEQCQPIAHQWDKETVRGSCWSPKVFTNFGIAVGAYSSLIDLCFSIYPPLIVSQLNMQLQKKVTVMIIFSLGLFAFFTTLYKTAAELPKLKDAQVNFSRVNAQVMLWTTLESSVVITAGSIPTWGWVFRTEKFETFVRWISLRSIRTHTSERLPSYGRETDKDSDRINLKEGRATPDEEQSRSMGLQSIVQIEREALS